MDLPSKAILDVLMFLMPGFITAALLYSLTPAPKPIPFERIVQALIFTIIIQACVTEAKSVLLRAGERTASWGPWTDSVAVVWSVAFALGLGVLMAWMANSDQVHGLLRNARITHQTSYASEWYGAFCRHQGYIVLHLTGNRRLLGWAEEWPSTPGVGHFVMAKAQWLLVDNKGQNEIVDLADVDRILIKAEDVEMVEMMELSTEINHGRSKGADTATTAAGEVRQGHDAGATAAVPAGAAPTTAAEEMKENAIV